jgi:monoamine oxidase
LYERDWATEEWTRGAYCGYMPPGVWTSYGHALRAPVGPIAWAGTETAVEHMGYMEGAIESGERAAAEVLAMQGARAAAAV